MTQNNPSDCIRSARADVALLNAGRMSRLLLGGKDGMDLLHRISTNDLLHTPLSSLTPTTLTSEKGRIIDALRVVQYGSGHLLLGSADAEEEVLRWLEKYTIADDVAVRSVTAESALFALVGPRSLEAAHDFAGNRPRDARAWTASVTGPTCFLVPDVTVALQRVFLFFPDHDGSSLTAWAGSHDICMLDGDAADLIRIMFGWAATPGEITSRFTPYDIGLDHTISTTKGCYIGQEVLARLETFHKVRRTLVGFFTTDATLPAAGDLLSASGKEIGVVTSMARRRLGGRGFGLAVAQRDMASGGAVLLTGGGHEVVTEPFPLSIPATGSFS